MRSKNIFYIISLSLYVLILFILSCATSFVGEVNIALASLFSSNGETVNTLVNVFSYIELVIFYTGLGIMITIVCIEYLEEFRYIISISIMGSLMLVVLSSVLKSFFSMLDYIKLIVTLISILFGIGLEILIKIKQIRGIKDEDDK